MRHNAAQPALSDRPLDALKDWLAVTGPREDAVLTACLSAACALCERFTGTAPLAVRVTDRFAPGASRLVLSAAPVRAVTAMRFLAPDGTATAIADSAWTAEQDETGRASVMLSIPAPAGAGIEVEFEAGTAPAWDALDANLAHGVLRYAAHLYRERDSGRADALPAAVAALWRPHRRIRL